MSNCMLIMNYVYVAMKIAAVGYSQAGSHVLAFSRTPSSGLLTHGFQLLAGPSGVHLPYLMMQCT